MSDLVNSMVFQHNVNDKLFRFSRKYLKELYDKGTCDIADVVYQYDRWVKDDTFVLVGNGEDVKEFKTAKRGNDVFSAKLYKKFKDIELGFGKVFGGVVPNRSNMVLASFTYQRDEGLGYYWDNVGEHFNIFMANLRQFYKKEKILCIRVWEAHRSGYPHIHALLIFEKQSFRVRKYRNKAGRIVNLLNDDIVNKLKSFWNFGYSNFNGVENPSDALKYVFKYLFKGVFDSEKFKVGMALLWLYGKRSYSVSRGLLDLIRVKNNSSVESSWQLLGFRFGKDLHFVVPGVDISGYVVRYDDPFLDYALTKHLITQTKL